MTVPAVWFEQFNDDITEVNCYLDSDGNLIVKAKEEIKEEGDMNGD